MKTRLNLLRLSRALALIALMLGVSAPARADLPASGQADCFDGTTVTACSGSVSTAMSYTKLDAAGDVLDASATGWNCVRDNVTRLVWENKTTDAGLRDVAHRYAWFSSDSSRNGGIPGGSGTTGTCGDTLSGQACTTANYVAAMNAANFCGANDWRLPTQMELLTLMHAGTIEPSIDTGYFPATAAVPYWSATPHAMMPASAWGVHFGYGAAHAESKNAVNALRLVRGIWGR